MKPNPLGPSQSKVLAFMIKNPKCSFYQIRESTFPDKPSKYLSNLLWELRGLGYVSSERSYDANTPTIWTARLDVLVRIINIGHFLKTGIFIGI